MNFIIRDRETGTFIDEFATLAEAVAALREYEDDDKRKGIYEANFYEIYNVATDSIEQ